MYQLFDGMKKSELIDEFNALLTDAEDLLKATASQSGDKIVELRGRVGESIRLAKVHLDEMETAVIHQTKAAAKATDAYVHENPWQSVGAAVSIGFIIGWLMKRN